MILICNTIMLFFLIAAFPVILPLVLTSGKRRKSVLQRLGLEKFPKQKIQPGGLCETDHPVWIHALSVGETFSAVELVKTLRKKFQHRKIYFSVSTATGFVEARKRLSLETDHIFFYPYDLVFVVRRVLRRVSPSLFILVESDIWPTFLVELNKRNVPSVLVNARLSDSSLAGYKKLSMIMAPVFNSFRKICVQSDLQGQRFLQLGVKPDKICVTGNLKFDQKPIPVSDADKLSMKNELAIDEKNRVFLAGSTHPGEEKLLLESFIRLRKNFSDLSLVVVPRDPDRADDIQRLSISLGFKAKKMSQIELEGADVVVVDMMGVLRRLYAIADIAFVGGSLVDFGGHNPLEPAAYAKPVVFGPHMYDFPEISGMLLDVGGAVRVHSPEQLYESVRELVMDQAKVKRMGENAFGVFQSNQGAVEKTAAIIKSIDSFFHEH